jgi:hypothetical protein
VIGLPQHPDEHRLERPVHLAVDQELGEGALAVRSRRRAVSNSSPAPCQVSHRRVGGLWWRGGSDYRCHQHRDHHHRRRNNRCARDHLLRPERIASVAASTGPRLAPRGCLGCPSTHRSGRPGRSREASGHGVQGCRRVKGRGSLRRSAPAPRLSAASSMDAGDVDGQPPVEPVPLQPRVPHAEDAVR